MQGFWGAAGRVRGVQSIRNFRSLGGQTTLDGRQVRAGLVYRSAHLAEATESDLQELSVLGIRTVFDFRNPGDLAAEGPNRLPKGVEQVSLPMADPANRTGSRIDFAILSPEELEDRYGNGKAFQWMKEASGRSVSDPKRSAQFGDFVRGLLAPGAVPVLFNCSAGKDRTGWAASLLLLAVGVSGDQVLEHYLETNRHVGSGYSVGSTRLARWDNHLETTQNARPGRYGDLLMPLRTVHEDYFAEQMRVLADTWGGFDQYWAEGLGLDDGHRQALREMLLV